MPHMVLVSLLVVVTSAGARPQPDPVLPVVTQTVDGVTLDVVEPRSPRTGRPAVVLVHGRAIAPFRTGERVTMYARMRALAARGYVAVTPSYRLAPVHRFPAAVQDITTAINVLRRDNARLGIDATRVCVVGEDAGGTLALLAALAPASHVACVVAIGALIDMRSLVESGAFVAKDIQAWLGGDPDAHASTYAQASPLTLVSPDDPPVLLLHGDRDGLAPVGHARALAGRIRAMGGRVTLEEIPGLTHTPSAVHKQNLWARVQAFLDAQIR